MNEMNLPNPTVVYVMDAYCGWCWGFSEQMKAFEQANRHRVAFTVISGGLFVGDRAASLSRFPHIQQANERIASLTGVTFGRPYEALLEDGQMVMDSLDAAAGFTALRELAPERAVHWVHELQAAFYLNGQSLSNVETILAIANANGLDAQAVQTALENGSAVAKAKQDFTLARTLGVSSYPTLLFLKDNQIYPLPATGTPLAMLNSKLDTLLSE